MARTCKRVCCGRRRRLVEAAAQLLQLVADLAGLKATDGVAEGAARLQHGKASEQPLSLQLLQALCPGRHGCVGRRWACQGCVWLGLR